MSSPVDTAARAAYLANGRPVERAAFYALACDPRRSAVVEACAGAGKTWMLVSRILRALLDGAEPHEILAITFTRKAAGEMRERLTEWLRLYASPATSDAQRAAALVERGVTPADAQRLAPSLAQLYDRVLQGGRPVQVSTFHAWFAQLLRAAPLELLRELGLQPDMTLIEDIADHRAAVFRRFHAALLRDPALQADHATLIVQRGRHQADEWFDAVWQKRVEFELADRAGVLEESVEPAPGDCDPADPTAHPVQVIADAAWDARLRTLARALAAGKAKAQAAAAGLVDALLQADPHDRHRHCRAALFTDAGGRRKLGAIEWLDATHDDLDALAERIHQHESRLEHLRMVRLSRVLLAELAGYKRSRGLAEMSDLERCGLALLRDATLSGWVQERLDARLRHVLIDEFQDTSPLQWHALFAWWSAYAGAGGGASGQHAPAIFVVGDPKQSIYRFRGAEPRVFEAARDFVVDGFGGDVLACDHTRRNAPEVISALNAVFDTAVARGEFAGFRAHTTEVASVAGAGVFTLSRVPRPPKVVAAGATPAPVWRDSLTTPRHEPREVLREQEAGEVADAVRALIDGGGVAPAEILVLSRKRQSLRHLADALRQRHVPCAAVEDQQLMDAPEARDLVALLDALVSPQHRLSLAQALRSPLFGAGDDDLIALAQVGGDWWHTLVDADLARMPSFSPALRRARALLPRWRTAAAQLPPHDLLDRIVAEGDLRARVAATVPPTQRAAALDAIDAVLAQALTLDGARYATPYNFVRALKRRSIPVTPSGQADAVRLLTVHGAKGLEARVVFVMDADPEPARAQTATMLIDWPVEASQPQRFAFVYSESRCPPSLAPLLAAEQRARQREELNGLYVAMSRAKRQLVFSATEPLRPPPGESWWRRVEALSRPWPGNMPTGPAPLAAIEATAPDTATAPFLLTQLPALDPPRPAAASASASAHATVRSDATDTAPVPFSTPATRLGTAVHRVLEWATRPGGRIDDAALAGLASAAAEAFDSHAAAIARLAGTILRSPACAPFFAGGALRWAGNEVAVASGGEVLRIDRLVRLDEAGVSTWWVLDYKLQHAPGELADHREQLRHYRDAVRRLQPGEAVRCAFVTGAGEVVEID